MDVGEMQLDQGESGTPDSVMERDRGMGIGAGVEYGTSQPAVCLGGAGLMDPIDEDAFMIGLTKIEGKAMLLARVLAQRLDVGQGVHPIDGGLASAQQVQVRSV
ncbi:MAG: hypothetical protein NVSMB6_16310 [Burkholderiaceae bacterium]